MTNYMQSIPENIKIYLLEIADKLKQGRAVVMVGSGFSQNAIKCRYTNKKFLNWNQLGDIFYEKLYCKKPQDEENPNFYQDILKLASKVQQCFGRTTLDRLLLDNLPDEEYEPSELHELLLKLNWTDIFTTNYDTLLERTRIKVFDRRYQVVLSKDDLVYSKCPRIIKLHGSFPSTRPFILTEEDYRRYPKDSAVFVNTVQQALIENVMCMVGFSGDDPNFLNWIGWIQDNLGNGAASKIYMIGVFDIKETELKLYESRNIILINMKDCVGIKSGQYKEGLTLFFQSLRELQDLKGITESYLNREDEIYALINNIIYNAHEANNSIEKNTEEAGRTIEIANQLKDLINFWKFEREHYPGWIIMPYKRREYLEKSFYLGNTLLQTLHKNDKLSSEVGSFLYEFDWRRNHCLLPLDPKIAEIYKYHLEREIKSLQEKDIDLPNTKKCLAEIEPYAQKKSKHLHNLSKHDMKLYLSLLCFFREHGNFDEWIKWEQRLSWYWLDEEQEILRYCERAYKLFYNFEYSELSEKLLEWPDEIKHGDTILLHAALLCELGYFEKAVWLLKLTLNTVRGQIGEKDDYQNYSKEAYIIVLLDNIETYFRFITSKDEKKSEPESYAHLRTLWSYDCNPEYEKDYLVNRAICDQRYYASNESDETYQKDAPSQLIKFMEQTGSIFRNSYLFRHDEEFSETIMRIAKANPYLALVCTLRFDDIIACQQIWGRETLAYLTEEQANQIIKTCILACKKNKGYILETLGIKTVDEEYLQIKSNETLKTSSKAKVKSIVTALPRLCPTIIAGVIAKASMELKQQAIDFISFALKNPDLKFASLDLMVKSVADSLTSKELSLCIDEFMKMPLGQSVEPFQYLDMRKVQTDQTANIQLESIPKSKTEGNELHIALIRKLAYGIIKGRAPESDEAANILENLLTHDGVLLPRPIIKIYYYYRIVFGTSPCLDIEQKELEDSNKVQEKNNVEHKSHWNVHKYVEKTKANWLKHFHKQVIEFTEIGRDYCPVFRKEMDELLPELKFFHYNNSQNLIIWNNSEIKEVIELLTAWANKINKCHGCECKTKFKYIEGWYTLWEILIEIILHGENKDISDMSNSLKELNTLLQQVNIPFVIGDIFLGIIPEFSKEIYDLLVPKLFENEKTFIEIGKLIGIYIVAGKGEKALLKQFWNLILHIGKEHPLEMTYLHPIVEEAAEYMQKNKW